MWRECHLEKRLELEFALHLLETEKPWTDRRRLDCVATILSLFAQGELFTANKDASRLFTATINGFRQKRYRVDSKLFRDLYSSCAKRLKLALVNTTTFLRLDERTFKTIFIDAYRRQASKPSDFRALASILNVYFLSFNSGAAKGYKDIILECLRSPKPELRMRGLYMAGFLDDLEMRDLQLMKEKIGARSHLRACALNGLCELLKRRRKVSPRVLAFCLDPKIQAKAERIYGWDADDGARLSAYYLLKAIRETRQDVRTLRKLKASGYRLP